MKRSEIVSIIEDYIEDIVHKERYALEYAEELLGKIEEAGMLPPEIINWEESSAIELHEWEKEDET